MYDVCCVVHMQDDILVWDRSAQIEQTSQVFTCVLGWKKESRPKSDVDNVKTIMHCGLCNKKATDL